MKTKLTYFQLMNRALKKYEKNYRFNIRMVALKMIMRNLKWIFCKYQPDIFNSDKKKIHVLFDLDGGLGDILIALNYIQNFYNYFGKVITIDIVVPPNLFKDITLIIKDQHYISQCLKYDIDGYQGYDIQINLVRIPIIKYLFNEKKIKTLSFDLYTWIKKTLTFCSENSEYTIPGTVSDGLLSWYSVGQKQNRLTQADILKYFSTKDLFKIPLYNTNDILSKFNLGKNKYIVLQNGAGLNSTLKSINFFTRDWPNDNFNTLVSLLKQNYPNYQIVQVGYDCQISMRDVDTNLLGRTDFLELLVILANAKLLIASESGAVHFRHFTSAAPSVVLFGPTRPEMYNYPENISIVSPICNGCEWMHKEWRNWCIKSQSKCALCMNDIKPDFVLEEIKKRNIL